MVIVGICQQCLLFFIIILEKCIFHAFNICVVFKLPYYLLVYFDADSDSGALELA